MELKEFEPEYIEGNCEYCYDTRNINKKGILRREYDGRILCGICFKIINNLNNVIKVDKSL